MRIQRAVLSVVLVGLLVGCTVPPEPDSSETPSAAPTPMAEVAPVGEAAIPLGCSELLDVSSVATLGADSDDDISVAIDEDHIAVGMMVAQLQLGTLHCVWASRYGATDFHSAVELRVAPSTATGLEPSGETSQHGTFAAVADQADTLLVCSDSYQVDETSALYNSCDVIQLRAGYRIDLTTSGLLANAGQDPGVAMALLAEIGAAIDAADPARIVEPVVATPDPAALCRAPEIVPVLEKLAAAGEPAIETGTAYPGVTSCVWETPGEHGAGEWTAVYVIPGGAWAIERLKTGVSHPFLPTSPSSDGTFLVGVGDGVSAWRAIGDDLVAVYGYTDDAGAGWAAFLEATW